MLTFNSAFDLSNTLALLKDEDDSILVLCTQRWVHGQDVIEEGVYSASLDVVFKKIRGVFLRLERVLIDGDVTPFHPEAMTHEGGLSSMPYPLAEGHGHALVESRTRALFVPRNEGRFTLNIRF